MTWTSFWDMHSGGSQKLSHGLIVIEGARSEAERVFRERFDRDPHNVTCDCCGSDYLVDEHVSLEQATGYHRGCSNLATPRDSNGRCRQPDDPWFHEHYYVEPGDVEEAHRRGYIVEEPAVSRPTQSVAEFVESGAVLVIRRGGER